MCIEINAKTLSFLFFASAQYMDDPLGQKHRSLLAKSFQAILTITIATTFRKE